MFESGAFVGTFGISFWVLVVFGFLAFRRYLRYKETVALAEKGLIRGQFERQNGHDSLRWGLVIASFGLALCLGMYPIGFAVENTYPLNFGPWMLVGLIPLFFGVALILIDVLTRKEAKSTPDPD